MDAERILPEQTLRVDHREFDALLADETGGNQSAPVGELFSLAVHFVLVQVMKGRELP